MKSIESPIIIAHSISPEGVPLITWQLRYWRAIHAELMTHRVFSRNAGSSRARPSATIIDSVSKEPWGPLHWGANQKGMQADQEHAAPVVIPTHLNRSYAEFLVQIHGEEYSELWDINTFWVSAQEAWHFAAWLNGQLAGSFDTAGYHKQIVNRITEPYNYIDVVLTSTDFANWYALRDHKDAQPEIRELASLMKEVQAHSTPEVLQPGMWHLPYADSANDIEEAIKFLKIGRITRDIPPAWEINELLKKASAARCARVSYKLFDGSNANFEKDLELFNQLLVSQPLHASPAEHQATPDSSEWVVRDDVEERVYGHPEQHGNFRGWCQHRKMLPNEFVAG
ncbi:putative thymidylate synthase [Xanthomonas virus PB119]|nr:putative thymidylate synthase [Xanthomonas virus PB119]